MTQHLQTMMCEYTILIIMLYIDVLIKEIIRS